MIDEIYLKMTLYRNRPHDFLNVKPDFDDQHQHASKFSRLKNYVEKSRAYEFVNDHPVLIAAVAIGGLGVAISAGIHYGIAPVAYRIESVGSIGGELSKVVLERLLYPASYLAGEGEKLLPKSTNGISSFINNYVANENSRLGNIASQIVLGYAAAVGLVAASYGVIKTVKRRRSR